MKQSRFFEVAQLMVRVIPAVAAENCFALKGGTAINLFVRDLPRISVDIDLTYVPVEPRDVSLKNISGALERIAQRIIKATPNVRIGTSRLSGSQHVTKLTIHDGKHHVKVEPNLVLRGTVYPTVVRSLSKRAERLFEAATSIQTLSDADLYAGKFCAALDRQHPRDIFDMKLLLENEGITEEIRRAFVVYLAGHDRPIHELLAPSRKDFRKLFETEFEEMSESPVSYDELVTTREEYINLATKALTEREKRFLMSLKSASPDWALLELPGIEKLPSLQWKLTNINRMDKNKRQVMLERLQKVLGV